MDKLQFYKFAAIGLFVLNIALLAFIIVGIPPKSPHKAGKKFAQKAMQILDLDEQQSSTFFEFTKDHKNQMMVIHLKQRELLEAYFLRLSDSTKDSNSETILKKIQELERNKIETTYQHFEEVESMLTEEQKPHFKKFMDEAVGIVLF
ncbi:MAG: hypothetical protein ACPG49_13730 [Chitinophagales bacterium]